MEDAMLKHLSIWAVLIAFASSSVNAQQQEAVLKTLEVPGAAFNIILAMPKSPGATYNLGNSPDALLVHLVGGELAIAYENAEQMLKALDQLRGPAFAFHAQSKDGTSYKPVAVYIVPKGE
jgi:hypothetical protein